MRFPPIPSAQRHQLTTTHPTTTVTDDEHIEVLVVEVGVPNICAPFGLRTDRPGKAPATSYPEADVPQHSIVTS